MEQCNLVLFIASLTGIRPEVQAKIVERLGERRTSRVEDLAYYETELEAIVSEVTLTTVPIGEAEEATRETLRAIRGAHAAYMRSVRLFLASDLTTDNPIRVSGRISMAMAKTFETRAEMRAFIERAYPRLKHSVSTEDPYRQADDLLGQIGWGRRDTLIRNVFAAAPGSGALLSYLATNLSPKEKRTLLDWLKALTPDELGELIKASPSETVRRRLAGKPVNAETAARILQLALDDDENGGVAIAELYDRCPSAIKVR